MPTPVENWKTQIRKGYLELCLLLIIRSQRRVYGFELLEQLERLSLPIKEGTLYPLLNRLTEENVLQAVWDTTNVKGHPRKFYSLTKDGARYLEVMRHEFTQMVSLFENLAKTPHK